jgi:hypothetical protein
VSRSALEVVEVDGVDKARDKAVEATDIEGRGFKTGNTGNSCTVSMRNFENSFDRGRKKSE